MWWKVFVSNLKVHDKVIKQQLEKRCCAKLQNRKKVDLELRLFLSTAVDAVGQFYHQTVCSRFRAHLYVQFSSLHHLNVRLTQCIQSVNALNSCHNRKPSAVQRAAPDSHSADAAPQQGPDTATLGRPLNKSWVMAVFNPALHLSVPCLLALLSCILSAFCSALSSPVSFTCSESSIKKEMREWDRKLPCAFYSPPLSIFLPRTENEACT